jgi:hypothetical protein
MMSVGCVSDGGSGTVARARGGRRFGVRRGATVISAFVPFRHRGGIRGENSTPIVWDGDRVGIETVLDEELLEQRHLDAHQRIVEMELSESIEALVNAGAAPVEPRRELFSRADTPHRLL